MNTIPVIPRVEDLPYLSSPPIQFTYQSTEAVSAGSYTWTDAPLPLVPDRPVMSNSLYYFRSLTLAADVDELDFTSNITVTPKFQMYLKSRAKAIHFREPIFMLKFLQNFEYRYAWLTQHNKDQLFCSFNGSLLQGAGLVGKASITLKAIISAQEVVDDTFISMFKSSYLGGRK